MGYILKNISTAGSLGFYASRLVFATLFACLSLTGLAAADGHFGMQWTYEQFNNPQNKGRTTSVVVVGVPETDNRMAYGECFAGSTAGFPTMEFAANTGNRRAGDLIDIQFFADTGPILFSGTVKAPQSEEDYSGVRIQFERSDPIWEIFKRMSIITYVVDGQSIDLPLRGSSSALGRFLFDCDNYQSGFAGNPAPQPKLPPANQASDPRWATCDTMRNFVSQNSDTPVRLTFRNRTNGSRGVLWIGFDGVPKDYANLNPGESFTINTFLTHPWMLTDGPGNCLEMYMPQQGVSVFDITAPNRDFGAE